MTSLTEFSLAPFTDSNYLLIGIGGLKRDPYVDDAGTGRVRFSAHCRS